MSAITKPNNWENFRFFEASERLGQEAIELMSCNRANSKLQYPIHFISGLIVGVVTPIFALIEATFKLVNRMAFCVINPIKEFFCASKISSDQDTTGLKNISAWRELGLAVLGFGSLLALTGKNISFREKPEIYSSIPCRVLSNFGIGMGYLGIASSCMLGVNAIKNLIYRIQ